MSTVRNRRSFFGWEYWAAGCSLLGILDPSRVSASPAASSSPGAEILRRSVERSARAAYEGTRETAALARSECTEYLENLHAYVLEEKARASREIYNPSSGGAHQRQTGAPSSFLISGEQFCRALLSGSRELPASVGGTFIRTQVEQFTLEAALQHYTGGSGATVIDVTSGPPPPSARCRDSARCVLRYTGAAALGVAGLLLGGFGISSLVSGQQLTAATETQRPELTPRQYAGQLDTANAQRIGGGVMLGLGVLSLVGATLPIFIPKSSRADKPGPKLAGVSLSPTGMALVTTF